MMMKMTIRQFVAVLAVVLGVVGVCAGQTTTISLVAATRAPAGGAIRVADIAQVSGEDAERLGRVVVVGAAAAVGGQMEIDIASVRSALESAGVNWGRTVLSGGTVAVRLTGGAAGETAAAAPVRVSRADADRPHQTVDLSAPPTVRTHIAARVAHLFGVEAQDLRLRFRAEDEALLATSTVGKRVDVQPAASAASSRLPLRVYVYTGDRISATGGVTVEVLVRRSVTIAAAPVERGQRIAPENTTTAAQWLEPNAKVPATEEEVSAGGGAVARNRIDAGEVITRDMIQPPLAAGRGDLVTVHCLSGSVTVRVRARALTDIRDGEVGGFRIEGSKKTFSARMDGPGRAVAVVGGAMASMQQEMGR